MIGTPDCPDNCGCSTETGVLTLVRSAIAIARAIYRGL
jgi:hypothetical protein